MGRIALLFSAALLMAGCDRKFSNPSDSSSKNFTVESAAYIKKISPGDILLGDSVFFAGGVTSQPVEKEGLVKEFLWDFNGDGTTDSSAASTDTLGIRFTSTGDQTIGIALRDGLGKSSEAETTVTVHQALSYFYADQSCAFYSQNAYSMEAVLLFCHFLTYRNKQDGMALGAFVGEILKNLAGTVNPLTFTLPYKTGFQAGVYSFSNDSLAMSAAFHYGPGMAGHTENDTVRYNLFSLSSYVTNIRATFQSPYYLYDKGPLFDLISNVSVDLSTPSTPKVTVDLDLFRLKFSCFRRVSDRYTLSGSRFDAVFFSYEGYARIHPFFLSAFPAMLGSDSFAIDMAGSEIFSPNVTLTLAGGSGSTRDSVSLDTRLRQTMLSQTIRFGNSGGNYRALGDYAAISSLQANSTGLVNSYFRGAYSSFQADTAFFFCDSAMNSEFGRLYFSVPTPDSLTFVSQKYSYGFTMGQETVIRQ